jgi:hypothetical protein
MLVGSVHIQFTKDWLMEVKFPLLSGVLSIDVGVLARVLLTCDRHDVHVEDTDQEVVELLILLELRAHEAEEEDELFSAH